MDNIENMTLAELKELAKEKGIKNISKLKKDELIEEIKSFNEYDEDIEVDSTVEVQ